MQYRLTSLIAVLVAVSLSACVEERPPAQAGVTSDIHNVAAPTQPPLPEDAPRSGALAHVGTGSIAVSIALPDRAVQSTVDDIARITLTLTFADASQGAVGTQELQRADILNRTATLHFTQLSAGSYVLTVTAWDDAGNDIGTVADPVDVQEGLVATLNVKLQLANGRPPAFQPSPLPSGPDGQPLVPTPAPATPRPIDAATPTPAPSTTPVPLELLRSPNPSVASTPTPSPALPAVAANYDSIFADGVSRQLAYPLQAGQVEPAIAALASADRNALDADLAAAKSETQQIFILKALAAGEPWSLVSTYANDMRNLDDSTVIADSTMHGAMDLRQQWQDACGPAVVETAGGEYDPRYAFVLHQQYQVSVVDPTGVNLTLADQQKQWLEAYGGVAVPVGQAGGKAIGIINLLADRLTPITHATYAAIDATADYPAAFEAMDTALRAGYAVPLRVLFTAEQYGHFIVALETRGARGQHEFLIHDSVSGKTAWVSQATILSQSWPFFNEPVQLTHYYQPTAQ